MNGVHQRNFAVDKCIPAMDTYDPRLTIAFQYQAPCN